MKELAESLRSFNTEVGDSTFVYCASESDDREILREAEKLLKSETRNPILVVKNTELAEELRMEPGKYYCYYKPSYLNGFRAPEQTTLDWPYLQALESLCRDEFTPIGEVINSEPYKEELKKSRNLHTK